jgi:hypothetical protein
VGACGEDEFRFAPFGKRQIIGWEGSKTSGQKESILLDMESFWPLDKFIIRAVSRNIDGAFPRIGSIY